MMMIQKKIAVFLSRLAQRLNPQTLENAIVVHPPVVGELLSKQTVLITGAAGSIGSAIAREMAAQGAKLILLDIRLEPCQALASGLGDCVIDSIKCDISNNACIDQLIDQLVDDNSGKTPINVDVLVHAAGIQYERSTNDSMQASEWHQTYNTNVVGPAYLCQQLKSKQGDVRNYHGLQSILFISSIHQSGVAGWPSYSSSKAALSMLVKELAIGFANDGIRVNSIAPGWVCVDKQQQPLRSRYALLKRESIPPESIARAAVFLSSEYCSSYTTGATLTIDAAMSLFNHRVDIEYTV